MHIQKLEVLVEVAKTKSISIAAQNLHMSQSGISQIITKIEEELGIKLFERSRLGAILTADGSNIIKKANEVLLKYEELMGEARKSSEIHTCMLRVSTVPPFINYLLKPLKEIRNLYPHSTIEFLEQITESTVELVRQNKADIGLIFIYDGILKNIEDLHFEAILEGKMKVYVASDSPFALKKTITPEEIFQQEVVLYNGDYIRWFIHHFQLTFGKMNILFSSNNTEELTRTVSNGLAISFAPDITMRNNTFVLEGKIVEVNIINYEPISTNLAIIHHKKRRPSKIEKHYIEFLRSEMCQFIN
ncbi:LysR family transcriptional regulator [Bacillus sp. UNC41MFS5]|uniref:LysR family transcriptional regulator n=1 Tax=Bacillus sp. UNC41MFS5 TaxID=1449046 RepID=UPI00047A8C62|nr:LysR family transcriptional regulator [Bacillus sp. UNC41MFS5]